MVTDPPGGAGEGGRVVNGIIGELEVGQKVICRVEGAWYRGMVVGGDLVKTCRVVDNLLHH